VISHCYQLVHNDWWAKDRGCVARATPGGDEVLHSEDLGSNRRLTATDGQTEFTDRTALVSLGVSRMGPPALGLM
jgi:hypothetical protein